MIRGFRFIAALFVASTAFAPAATAASIAAAPKFDGPFIQRVEAYTTKPVRDLPLAQREDGEEEHNKSVGENEPRVPPDAYMDRIGWGSDVLAPRDPLADLSSLPGVNTPSPISTLQGMSNTCGCSPPDPMISVGPNHVVQVVNATSLEIFNKSGAVVTGPVALNTLWPAGLPNCRNSNDGDPVVAYDWLADRWLLAQFSTGNAICVAVSQTANPTGAYNAYEFATPTFPDYFKIGTWGDAYYVGANENSYSALALNRTAMLAGTAATSIRFTSASNPNFLMPATMGGRTAPPAGAPGIFYTFLDNTFHGGADRLEFYHFTANFTTPASSTFTLASTLPIAAYTYTVCGFFNLSCIPQLGTAQKVDAVSEWPMWQLQYRNFGAGNERLAGSFTVDAGSDRAAPRWFEVRKTAPTTYSLFQEGTISPADTTSRFMTSAAFDQCGNIAVGYSASSTTINPSLRYATRLTTDPVGTMQAEATLFAGTGSQTGSNRWGDYAAVVLDPEDECTFWMTGEYFATNSSNAWTTRIGKFKLPECSATCGAPATTLSINDVAVTEGNAGTTTATFTITRSNNTAAASVTVGTANGTATSGSDYTAIASQVVNFTAGGALTATVAVTVSGDTVLEANETFNVNLTSPTGATISDATGLGTINNDDAASIAVNDVTLAEGNAGTTAFTFTTTLTGAVQGGFNVNFSTSNGTATQPGDYATNTGTLAFAGSAGETKTFTVNVVGETQVEANEVFNVALGAPSNAAVTVSDGSGVGTITNDDSATVAINNVTLVEGNAGTTAFAFTVTLTGSVQGGVSVPFSTANGTATQPADYGTASGNVVFAGSNGETQPVTVQVVGELVTEANETFVVNLGTPTVAGVTAAIAQGTGTITNDDSATVAINNVTLVEGNAGTTAFAFTVTLTGSVQGGVSVPFSTANGTATQPADYGSASGNAVFAGSNGETQPVTVQVIGDLVTEPNETFFVNLGTPSVAGVTASTAQGTGTITNDDSAADVSVTASNGVSQVFESGTTTYTVVVTNTSALADVAAVAIAQTVTPGLVGLTWTCTGSGGATCPASGSGVLAQTRALPASSSLTFLVTADIAAGAPPSVTTTVTATVQAPATDPVPANNVATDTDAVVPDALFKDGFE